MKNSKKLQEKVLARTQKPHQFTTIQFNSGKITAGYKLSTKKPVDMDNDYYPFVNFSLVWPETMPDLNGQRDFFLVVVVNSAARGEKYRLRREAIRKTWAKHRTKCERLLTLKNPKLKNHQWILVFSLGKGDTADDKANAEEAKIHNDVLIGNFEDNYINCVMKSFMGRLWVSSLNVRYVLKTDDDVFVRIPSIIDYLMAQGYPKPFYGGAPYFNFKVDRDPNGKWAISKKYFNEEYFPTFNAGGFYVLSTDILFKLFNYVRQRPPFQTEDTYIGIAARDMNISPQRIPGLLLEDFMSNMLRGMSDTTLIQARGYGHDVDPSTMNTVFNRLEELCARNKTN